MAERKLEPYVVDSVQFIGESLALVSTTGVVFCRPTNTFARIPQAGNHLELETLDGCRITGLKDGDDFLFHYSDHDLAEQERALHAHMAELAEKTAEIE